MRFFFVLAATTLLSALASPAVTGVWNYNGAVIPKTAHLNAKTVTVEFTYDTGLAVTDTAPDRLCRRIPEPYGQQAVSAEMTEWTDGEGAYCILYQDSGCQWGRRDEISSDGEMFRFLKHHYECACTSELAVVARRIGVSKFSALDSLGGLESIQDLGLIQRGKRTGSELYLEVHWIVTSKHSGSSVYLAFFHFFFSSLRSATVIGGLAVQKWRDEKELDCIVDLANPRDEKRGLETEIIVVGLRTDGEKRRRREREKKNTDGSMNLDIAVWKGEGRPFRAKFQDSLNVRAEKWMGVELRRDGFLFGLDRCGGSWEGITDEFCKQARWGHFDYYYFSRQERTHGECSSRPRPFGKQDPRGQFDTVRVDCGKDAALLRCTEGDGLELVGVTIKMKMSIRLRQDCARQTETEVTHALRLQASRMRLDRARANRQAEHNHQILN
ncbi:hypothetical protein B0H19DRAFT_1063369 [Mycena capillaripes]|nr:hypothetical protein B0H19DRAFT_1063369 [Mycena capillaripes]